MKRRRSDRAPVLLCTHRREVVQPQEQVSDISHQLSHGDLKPRTIRPDFHEICVLSGHCFGDASLSICRWFKDVIKGDEQHRKDERIECGKSELLTASFLPSVKVVPLKTTPL